MQEESRFEDFVGLIGAIDKEIQRIKTAELGFVEVGEESTRYRAPIHLTEKGYAAMAEVNGLISQIVRQAGGGLMDEQRRALYASLESVLGQLRVIAR